MIVYFVTFFQIVLSQTAYVSVERVDIGIKSLDSENIYTKRLVHLKNTCQQLKSSSDKILIQNYTLFNPKLKIHSEFIGENRFQTWYYGKNYVMCTPPKAGTTNWQKTLVALKRRISTKKLVGLSESFYRILPRVLDLKRRDKSRLNEPNSYENLIKSKKYKIISVRHPVERLFSAWHDKFNKTNKYSQAYQAKYAKSIPKNYPTPENYLCSFQDFIDYWLENINFYINTDSISKSNVAYNKIMNNFDHHWRTMVWQCLPCNTDFDFITKLESIDEDSRYILKNVFGVPELFWHKYAVPKELVGFRINIWIFLKFLIF